VLVLTLFTLFVYWLSVSAFWLPKTTEERPEPAPQQPVDQRLPPASGSAPR
jgi:hypothetical protein